MKTTEIPTTLDSAIEQLYSTLTKEDTEFIKKNDHSSIHFSGGMQMRNDWHLWDIDSPIRKDIQKRFKLAHADDCSGLIFTGLWAKVKGEDVNAALSACADNYTKYWAKMGVDPITGKQIGPSIPMSFQISL